jgi:rRNA maturation endonuclease Nob1
MVDIIKRLRLQIHTSEDETALTNEAADEIERLREALKNMLRWHDQLSPADIAKAEAALKEGNNDGFN